MRERKRLYVVEKKSWCSVKTSVTSIMCVFFKVCAYVWCGNSTWNSITFFVLLWDSQSVLSEVCTHTHTHTLNCINSQNHVHLSNQKGNVLEKCFIEDVRKSPHMSHAQPYNILSLKFQTLFNSDHEFLKPISFWFIILPECCLFHRHSTWFKEKP